MPDLFLVGDVGATWTRLALHDGELQEIVVLPTADHRDLRSAVAHYLSGRDVEPVAAVIGVAGPVVDGEASLTNGDWSARASDLPQPARLINDLEAAAHGIGCLGPGAARRICGPAPAPDGDRIVLGIGTGHGQALWTQGRVLAGEGGHADFCPGDVDLVALADGLRPARGRVSVEAVLSGRGMDDVLRFAATRASLGAEATAALHTQPSAQVVAAMASQDAACARARSLFIRALGCEAGNAALRVLPRGGVWLTGGVAQGLLLPAVDAEITASFCAKAPMSELLSATALLVVENPLVGLLGAGVVAQTLAH